MKRACVALLILMSSACGGDNPSSPSPFTDQISSTVQAATPSIGFVGFTRQDFTPPRAGSLAITLTWNFPSVNLDLWLSTPACADVATLVGGGCTVLGRSEAQTSTSERVVATVVQGSAVRIWVLNYSAVSQGYAVALDIR